MKKTAAGDICETQRAILDEQNRPSPVQPPLHVVCEEHRGRVEMCKDTFGASKLLAAFRKNR